MGEIGISRHEFLYDIRFWEARRIIRGFRKRDRFTHQMLAYVGFMAKYANPYRRDDGKTMSDLFPKIFNDDDIDYEPPITQEEQDELQAFMAAENARLASERKSSEE